MFKNHFGLKGQEDHMQIHDFRTLQTTFGWLFYCVNNKNRHPSERKRGQGISGCNFLLSSLRAQARSRDLKKEEAATPKKRFLDARTHSAAQGMTRNLSRKN